MDRDEEVGPPAELIRVQQQRSSIPSFLFIIFLLFMLTNHSGDEFLARSHYHDALEAMTKEISDFRLWMNGTESNFTVPEKDPAIIPVLDHFMTFGSRVDPSSSSYITNVTGFIRGDVAFHNISPVATTTAENSTLPYSWAPHAQTLMTAVNMNEIVNDLGSWNWSASSRFSWSVIVRPPVEIGGSNHSWASDLLSVVHGKFDFIDPDGSEDMRLDFEGVHFLANGSIYGFAEPSSRHIDVRLIPSLVPEAYRNATALVIEPELISRMDKLHDMIDAGIIDQEHTNEDTKQKSNCGFTVYAQLEPSQVSLVHMQEFEEELQRPTGQWTVDTPSLSMNGVLLSKRCGILFKLHNTEGLRSRTFFRKVTTYAGLSALVYLTLLVLFIRQMDRGRTPANLSRVSRWTFLTQAAVDAVSFAGHITFAILADGRPSLALVAPAFLACILFALEAQFSTLVNQIQAPEDAVSRPSQLASPQPRAPSGNTDAQSPVQQEQLLATQVSVAQVVPAEENTQAALPQTSGPLAGPPRSTNFFALLVRHLRADPQARIWLGMFVFLTLIVRIIVSPSVALFFVGAMYSMFWLPQIVRSAKRGRSSALSIEYLIGVSICRLYFALYFLSCPKNVLDVEPRPWVYFLAVFMLAQVLVVILQEQLGPAFFLPKRYANAQTYDYHPPLPFSPSDAESQGQSLGDCAICMETIQIESPGQSQPVAGSLLCKVTARKNYSLAPCHHSFHTACLEKWLAIKNICPQCRRPLPPL